MTGTQGRRPILAIAVALSMGTALIVHSPGSGAQTLERRVDRLEDRVSGQAMMRMMNQSEQLQREVTTLRGEIERLQRQIDDIRSQQRELYLDLDGRLQALESAGDEEAAADGPAAGEPASADASADSGGEAPADTGASDGGDAETDSADAAAREAYDAAFSELRAGRYDAAAAAFQGFLQDYPEADLAANARYWLGESHYVVRDFDTALESFEQVVDNHADSRKHPDALLKIGYVHLEQGRDEQGRAALREVIEAFPDSTAASLAQQRLDER
ncbi:tol-pal system protein YbgF [Spiribacter sp. 1M153]|uniref:tol-pal system protein YbgF n=1 Tax=Spiribacter roseus TaxID=1855875 RepID=UPI00349FCE90